MAYSSTSTILDTSIWVAYLYDNDSQHARAVKLLQKISKSGSVIIIPEYVLLETATILRSKKYEDAAQKFIRRALETKKAFLPAALLEFETAKQFVNHRTKLSFVDVALLLLSQEYDVLTFDKQLQKEIKSYTNAKAK